MGSRENTWISIYSLRCHAVSQTMSCPRTFPLQWLNCQRYIRAYEVGQPPAGVKYELAIKLKTARSGPVIKSRIRLPHPVRTAARTAVICRDGSKEAEEALLNGAWLVGEESIFEAIRKEEINFDKLICHASSEAALNKAGLGRVLGPKGLMPSRKMKTVVDDVKRSLKEISGAEEYRERVGVLRLPVGQLGYTPRMLSDNIQAFVSQVKKECGEFDDNFVKTVSDIVLTSSHGPGFSLNGMFSSADGSVTEADLSSTM
jgi:large subunit ribosomal protein L1